MGVVDFARTYRNQQHASDQQALYTPQYTVVGSKFLYYLLLGEYPTVGL